MLCLAVIMSAAAMLTFASCAGAGGKKGEIWIKYFEGGFGSKWLLDATERYKAENPDVTFKLQADPQLRTNAAMLLSAREGNVPDIIISQNFNWQDSVQLGNIAPLDDIYNKPVAQKNGQDVLLKDYIVDDYKAYPWTSALPGAATKHAWIIPWSSNTTSLAYNDDLLKKTENSVAGGFWTAPPTDENGLKQFVADINTTSAKGGYSGKTVYPFVWPGDGGSHWLTFLQKTWWAQYQGLGNVNPEGDGSWYDFWDFDKVDVFKQKGLVESFRLLQELFVERPESDPTKGTWKNTLPIYAELNTTGAELEFIKGGAVMMPVGSWLEREMETFWNDPGTLYPNMKDNLRMMMLPNINGARSTNLNNAAVGDFMCVAEKGLNKELAKDFLLFITKESEVLEFTKNTGMMRPFQYDPIALAPDHAWTVFQRDTIKMFTELTNFYEYSKKESPLYIFSKLEPYQPNMLAVISNNLTMTPQEVVDASYTFASGRWPTWRSNFGLPV